MKIAIAGYGLEGKANYQHWQREGNELTILDERDEVDDLPDDVLTVCGKNAFADLSSYDMVIRSPSIPPKRLDAAQKVWSATNEFFDKCPAQIIGVTGTKGKGTTSSLIASMLQAAGKRVHLVGNIGTSALAVLPRIQSDDVVVFELSSFQLWDAQRSPHVAVVLGIEADHLDVHESMDEYVSAKARITFYQSVDDVLVYNSKNHFSRTIARQSKAQKIEYPFDIETLADSLNIPGQHNVENASAAIAAVRKYVTDPNVIRHGLANFTGLPHRLKFVAQKNEVAYYDDSIATTPGSAIAALQSFDAPKVLILGGKDKGGDYTELYEAIKASHSMRAVITMGANGEKLAEGLRSCIPDTVAVNDQSHGAFDAVFSAAVAVSRPGDVVVFSPAAASFDMFKNYADRGDTFIRAVESL